MADTPAGIGHNNGPTMESGRSWRVHSWTRAKANAPEARLPVEIVRMRIKRAAELGMDYRSYAALRASAGRDVAGLVITSNALGLHGNRLKLSDEKAEKLDRLRHCRLTALLHPPLDPQLMAENLTMFHAVFRAPRPHANWPSLRAAMARIQDGLPGAAWVMIGVAGPERDWAGAGRLAGFLEGERYFGAG